VWRAALILVFIILYKYPDYLVSNMATPFLLNIGFSTTEIGAIQGGLGIVATIIGALAGGSVVAKLGMHRSLWVFGGFQAVSNLAYFALAHIGADQSALVATILIENFCGGLSSAGFIAFLMSLCSAQFSATQYALLSSLFGASRDVLVAPAGIIAAATGWPLFFLISTAAAIPGMLLLPYFAPWRRHAGQ
jgi:PAT family beta-lactamase induction signal transducer AmpG